MPRAGAMLAQALWRTSAWALCHRLEADQPFTASPRPSSVRKAPPRAAGWPWTKVQPPTGSRLVPVNAGTYSCCVIGILLDEALMVRG